MSAFFCYTDFELCLLGRVPDFTRKGGAEGVRYRPIRRNSEYGRVYARGKSYVNPALVLYVLKTRGKKTRVGLTATKKIGYDLVFVARGITPHLKSWQLSEVVAKLFAQAGLPDKAKQPGAKPPATVPPAQKPAPQE